MTPSELKYEHQAYHPESHFFDKKSLQFFGDTIKNYGVRTTDGLWELYRKKPVKYGLQDSAYFDKVTYAVVHRNSVGE